MIKKIFYRSPHNYDLDEASNEAVAYSDPHSLTIQSQTEDADLNVMMRRFGVTGQLPQSINVPQYGDFSGVTDYQSALHAIRDANNDFMRLPPDLRAQYQNNPQLFLEAVESGEALEALKSAGLTVSSGSGAPNGTPRYLGIPAVLGGF